MRRLFGAGAEVLAVAVSGDIPEQPFGDTETRRGAVNRARAALASAQVDFGIGLEGGVLEVEDEQGHTELYTNGWCAVIDRNGVLGVAGGANLLLPDSVAAAVRAGDELGPVMDRLTGKSSTHRGSGAIGVLTRGWLDRQEAFEQILIMAFARFLSPCYYTDGA